MLAFTALSVLAAPAFAQGPVKTPRVHALTNARIISSPGQVIENGTIVLRNGVIESVGANVAPPADARIWDLDSAWVYPGMVDLAMPLSLPEEEEEEESESLEHSLSVVRPDAVIADAMPLSQAAKESHRAAGITTVRVFPNAGTFRGQAAILNLGEGGLGENLIAPHAGQVVSFSGKSGGYPQSTMGVTAVIRQTLADASWYAQAHAAYENNPRGLERPEFNAAWEALVPAVTGSESMTFYTDDILDVIRADGIAEEFNVRFDYIGSGEEYKRMDAVTQAGGTFVLPVNYPKAPEVGTGKGEALKVSLEALRRWDNAPGNAAKVHAAGVQFALSAAGLSDVSKFRANVAEAIDAGLPRDAALAACTTVPALIAGIDNQCGRLQSGLAANLVVVDGELFADSTSVMMVWVDGEVFEIEKKEPPEGDPRGVWSFVAVVDGFEIPGELTIGGEIGALTATMSAMGSDIEVNCAQSGKTVLVSFPGSKVGASGVVRWSLVFEGDTASGSGTYDGGDFSITAKRIGTHGEASPGRKGAR